MPSLEYFLICESVTVDQESQRISLFNVMEEVRVPTFPGHIPLMAVVTGWNLDQADLGQDFQVEVRFRLNDAPAATGFHMNFHARTRRHRLAARLEGFPVAAPGELRTEILLNGQHQASHTITVVAAVVAIPEPAQAPT